MGIFGLFSRNLADSSNTHIAQAEIPDTNNKGEPALTPSESLTIQNSSEASYSGERPNPGFKKLWEAHLNNKRPTWDVKICANAQVEATHITDHNLAQEIEIAAQTPLEFNKTNTFRLSNEQLDDVRKFLQELENKHQTLQNLSAQQRQQLLMLVRFLGWSIHSVQIIETECRSVSKQVNPARNPNPNKSTMDTRAQDTQEEIRGLIELLFRAVQNLPREEKLRLSTDIQAEGFLVQRFIMNDSGDFDNDPIAQVSLRRTQIISGSISQLTPKNMPQLEMLMTLALTDESAKKRLNALFFKENPRVIYDDQGKSEPLRHILYRTTDMNPHKLSFKLSEVQFSSLLEKNNWSTKDLQELAILLTNLSFMTTWMENNEFDISDLEPIYNRFAENVFHTRLPSGKTPVSLFRDENAQITEILSAVDAEFTRSTIVPLLKENDPNKLHQLTRLPNNTQQQELLMLACFVSAHRPEKNPALDLRRFPREPYGQGQSTWDVLWPLAQARLGTHLAGRSVKAIMRTHPFLNDTPATSMDNSIASIVGKATSQAEQNASSYYRDLIYFLSTSREGEAKALKMSTLPFDLTQYTPEDETHLRDLIHFSLNATGENEDNTNYRSLQNQAKQRITKLLQAESGPKILKTLVTSEIENQNNRSNNQDIIGSGISFADIQINRDNIQMLLQFFCAPETIKLALTRETYLIQAKTDGDTTPETRSAIQNFHTLLSGFFETVKRETPEKLEEYKYKIMDAFVNTLIGPTENQPIVVIYLSDAQKEALKTTIISKISEDARQKIPQ